MTSLAPPAQTLLAQSSMSSAMAPPLSAPYAPPATPPSPPQTASAAGANSVGVPCPMCQQTFSISSEWTRHVDWVHSREDCGVCGKVSHGRQNATFHLQECHTVAKPTQDSIGKMMQKSSGRFPCPVCPAAANRDFSYANGLVKHLLERHMKRGCGVCGLTVPMTGGGGDAAERMVRHIRQNHFPVGSHDEFDDEEDEDDEDDEEHHVLPVLEEPPPMYQCLLCGRGPNSRVFSAEETLRDHQRQHHDVFFCKVCGDTINGNLKYREHQKFKHPLTERTNNVDVSSTAAASTANKPFLAPLPPKLKKKTTFTPMTSTMSPFPPAQPSLLKVSEQVAPSPPMQQRRFSCPRCAYQATQRANLLRHFEAFHITFRCRICSELQMSRKTMVDHVRKEHSSLDDRYDVKDAHFETDRVMWREIQRCGEDSGTERSNYGCPSCNFKSNSYTKWLKHQCRNKDGARLKMYQCPYCQMSCPSGAEVAEHMTKLHGVVARFSPSQKRNAAAAGFAPGSNIGFDENYTTSISPGSAMLNHDEQVFKVPKLSAKKKRVKKSGEPPSPEAVSSFGGVLQTFISPSSEAKSGSDTESLEDDSDSSFISMGAYDGGEPMWGKDQNVDVRSMMKRSCESFRLQCEAESFLYEQSEVKVPLWDACFDQAVGAAVRGCLESAVAEALPYDLSVENGLVSKLSRWQDGEDETVEETDF